VTRFISGDAIITGTKETISHERASISKISEMRWWLVPANFFRGVISRKGRGGNELANEGGFILIVIARENERRDIMIIKPVSITRCSRFR